MTDQSPHQLMQHALQHLQAGEHDAARGLLDQVLASTAAGSPDHVEALSLKGLSLVGEDLPGAMDLLQQAVEGDPDEPQFRVQLAAGLMAGNDFVRAENQLRTAVTQSEGAEQAIAPLADCLMRQGKTGEAEAVLQQGLVRTPESSVLRRLMSQTRFQVGDTYAAFDLFTGALGAEGPTNPADALTLARLANQIMDFKTANFAVERAREMLPAHPEVAISAATNAEIEGDRDGLNRVVSIARDQHPDHPRLLAYHIAHADDVTPADIDKAESLVRLSNDRLAARELQFTLARYWDKAGDYERAWDALSKANQLYDAPSGPFNIHKPDFYTAQRLDAHLAEARKIAAATKAVATSNLTQIILAGPPRTGGSLLQTVLGAAPGVASVGERAALLPAMMTMIDQQATEISTDLLDQLQAADRTGLERMGISETRFVDKTPHNFHVLGMLARVHPDTVVIDVQRDPRDVFISIMIHNLATHPYATDPEKIVTYLEFRKRAIEAWREDGVKVIPLRFEAFLDDPAGTGAALFGELGIDWDPAFLKADNRRMPVKTFSALQVTEEINDRSRGRWKHYERFIAPVLPRLAALTEEQTRRELIHRID